MTRAAVAIISRDGRLLVGQRKKESRYGLKWEFPGGKIEAGESVLACVKRELMEEIAVTVDAVDRSTTETHRYPDGGEFEVHFCFISGFRGEPVNLAFEELRWVTIAELRELDILEGNKSMVAGLDESMFSTTPARSPRR